MGFGVLVEFGDEFVKDLLAGLVAVDFDEETFGLVIMKNGSGLGAEFLEAGGKNLGVLIVGAIATIA